MAPDFFVDELRLEAAAVRLPLLAPFFEADFFEVVDFDADFFAPVFFDPPLFEPPRADVFDALLVPDRALDFDADFPALLLAPLFVVALAIINLLRGPLQRDRTATLHRQLGDDGRVPQKLKSAK